MTYDGNIFYSKKDMWLGVLIWAPMLAILIWMFVLEEWIAIVIIALSMVPIWYIWFETKYLIEGDMILVKIGGFTFYKIRIKEIIHIKRSRSWLSAPANSLERLEIKYARWSKLMISPENEWIFLEKIKAVNPNIDIQLENKFH